MVRLITNYGKSHVYLPGLYCVNVAVTHESTHAVEEREKNNEWNKIKKRFNDSTLNSRRSNRRLLLLLPIIIIIIHLLLLKIVCLLLIVVTHRSSSSKVLVRIKWSSWLISQFTDWSIAITNFFFRIIVFGESYLPFYALSLRTDYS